MATMYSNALTRVSPGVYRNRTGGLVQSVNGRPAAQQQQATTTQQQPQPFNAARAQTRIDYLKRVRPNDAQIGQLQNQITTAGQQPSQTQTQTQQPYNLSRAQTRLDYLKRVRPNDPEIAKLTKQIAANQPTQTTQTNTTTQAPAATETTPAPAPAPTPAAAPTVADLSGYQSPMTKALFEAMKQGLNTMQAYEPQNFEGSPLYQFQKQKGMQDLEKLMAARGLTGSGAEVQANADFLSNIGAQESEKQRQYADQAAQRAQQAMQFIANFDAQDRQNLVDQWNKNLDRQTNIQQFEANRQDTRDSLATNFLMNILNMQSDNNIAQMAQNGMNNQTDLTKALLGMTTNNIAANTPRVYAGGGGAPPPPQSGMSNVELAKILSNYGNRAGNNDTINTIIKTLFGG